MLMSRYIDRIGADRAWCSARLLIGLQPAAVAARRRASAGGADPRCRGALGCFSTNSAQQARLVVAAPALAPGSMALNSSAIYIGQAVGAAAGGWLIAHDASAWMNWVGLATVLLAMGLSVTVDRAQRRAAAFSA